MGSIRAGQWSLVRQPEWEGDVLILALDGDAEEMMAGWTDCRVTTGMVNEGDEVIIEFPNGSVDCTELLAEAEL